MADAPKGFGTEVAAQQPPNTFILMTNLNSQNWIVLPNAGTLWVGLEQGGTGAVSAEIWHQGGQTENIPLGFNTFDVGAGDAILYTDGGNPMKLGWAYT